MRVSMDGHNDIERESKDHERSTIMHFPPRTTHKTRKKAAAAAVAAAALVLVSSRSEESEPAY